MGIYDLLDEYLPEAKELRAKYDRYIKNNNISKTNTEKLYDYFILVSKSYIWDRDKCIYNFKETDIASAINIAFDENDSDIDDMISEPIYRTVGILASKSRHKKMQDCAQLSDVVHKELCAENTQGCTFDNSNNQWYFKTFPLAEKMSDSHSEEMKNVVRYALNVKPNIGLFKKLDDLSSKHKAFYYKVARQDYNTRVDPIIIYAAKDTQKEMTKDLSAALQPYRRKDKYEALGYQNIDNLIYTADETKKEKIEEQMSKALNKEEAKKFARMREIYRSSDKYNACRHEYWELVKEVYKSGDMCKRGLMNDLNHFVNRDYCVSLSDFKAYTIIVDSYCAAKQQDNSNILLKSKQPEHRI